MRIASWNINSVRIRFDLIKDFVEKYDPDILCLQETKTEDDFFPHKEMQSLGFNYRIIRGEKSYNGVAILSKIPISLAEELTFINNQARHISVIINDDIELHNFYFPAGGDIPDPVENPKFAHKLKYIENVSNWFKRYRSTKDKIILLGDLNVAPGKNDVWSHKQLLDVVCHTYMEVYHFQRLLDSINFSDSIRKFVSQEDKLYTWWSYRNKDWKRFNKGRRLDHILTTSALEKSLTGCSIYKESRDADRPSDHVPVLVDFNFS
ncbi:MAG: exodeoxyribonuclease III [Alphaproteobacteria bacterium]|nr:exodeoxyribonuclease III [Alphaproteobacteria bacterium]